MMVGLVEAELRRGWSLAKDVGLVDAPGGRLTGPRGFGQAQFRGRGPSKLAFGSLGARGLGLQGSDGQRRPDRGGDQRFIGVVGVAGGRHYQLVSMNDAIP